MRPAITVLFAALPWLLASLSIVTADPVQASDAVRCKGRLLDRGDPAMEVQHYCGEPAFVDPWTGSGALAHGRVYDMEAWTYNWGPGRLMQIFVFRNGKVASIENAGYGFNPGQLRVDCSSAGGIGNGMSKYQLVVSCGSPDQRSGHFVLSSRFSSGARDYYLGRGVFPVYRETWLYNFGPNRLQREVILENGQVVDTQALDRGF